MNEYLWPTSRLNEALQSLATESGLSSPTRNEKRETRNEQDVEAQARRLGLEAQPVETPYPDLERQLPKMAPALIQIGSGYLAILNSRPTILSPTGKKIRIPATAIRSALCSNIETTAIQQIDTLLTRAQIPPAKQTSARTAILREQLSTTLIRGIWLLRLPPSADFWQQLRQARVPGRLLALVGAHAIQYILWILAWWVIGANVLSGRTDQSWLWLWALLLLTLVPFRVLVTWLQGRIAISTGARLKQRLFFGALRLEPDSIRHQGAGQLLGRVIETEAVESLALSGGFLGLVAVIELAISVFILAAGSGGALQSLLLIAWLTITMAIASRYYRRNRIWTDVRLRMTHDLVESMVGHRTRLAQLRPDRWHQGEDEALERYLKASKAMDNSTAALLAIVPRGWLVLGLLGLIPAFAHGINSTAQIAIAVGGMLLAYRAFRRLAAGAWQLAGAAVAWQRVAVLFNSARSEPSRDREGVGCVLEYQPSRDREGVGCAAPFPLVDARDLVFRYSDRTQPVLRGCTFQISAGDRLVLEGASGGGKSTLVSLLAGLREPNSGRLLMNGFDRQSLSGEAWHKYIAAAPQFHENHVLAETFAFNLFMGRRGIIGPQDLAEAEEICAELGLAELLERMPAGFQQMVGETGWQLSHGERSRLYIARALLQNSELVVLDESFAALDPENLQRAVECVVKRAKSLLVIAHR
jgi:ATP-binding cassette, subfamily B, bacterial